MKSPFSVKIVVWSCNLTLVILSLSFLLGIYYYTQLPSFIALDSGLEGVTEYRASQSFLGDNYLYERVIDKETGVDEGNYYFASSRNLYSVSFPHSLTLSANKVNRDLSSSENRYFGFFQKRVNVIEPAGETPVRYAAPAISLEKEAFVSYTRSNVLSLLFVILYGTVFIWYLRKFVTGLRILEFFTHSNVFYLKITAWMTIAAPFLIWFWNSVIRPDLFADLQFANASEVSTGFSQPLLMLLFGLVLLVIAWCFDQGVKLQKEQELTI